VVPIDDADWAWAMRKGNWPVKSTATTRATANNRASPHSPPQLS